MKYLQFKEILEYLNTIGFKHNISTKCSIHVSEVDKYSSTKLIRSNVEQIPTCYSLTVHGQNWLDSH